MNLVESIHICNKYVKYCNSVTLVGTVTVNQEKKIWMAQPYLRKAYDEIPSTTLTWTHMAKGKGEVLRLTGIGM